MKIVRKSDDEEVKGKVIYSGVAAGLVESVEIEGVMYDGSAFEITDTEAKTKTAEAPKARGGVMTQPTVHGKESGPELVTPNTNGDAMTTSNTAEDKKTK